ncbi:MAG TPA: exodeoxyribonuclease V subunit gamma, partial [Waddliaceae bacterium]
MFNQINEENNFGIKNGEFFLSNSVEVLFEHFKINLFAKDGCVFAERFLIAPSLGMQQWVHMQLASTLPIACGITTTFLNKGIDILREKLFYTQKEYFLPAHLELFLRIKQEIDLALDSSDPIWQPLIAYVQGASFASIGQVAPRGKEGRKIALAKHLTTLFERYGIYANRACLEWEKKPCGWQEALWAKIFHHWDYPQRALLALRQKKNIPSGLSVHLFAFSHISPLHFQFLCKASCQVPIYFYQLSPCQEFWSDLPCDHPTLLGSMGKVGKEMAKLIEESNVNVEEAYVVFGGNTRLKSLQRSLLTLQTTENILDNGEIDDSIQIHRSATCQREIENLYQRLLSILTEEGMEPKDVIVMAPQITTYAPYIQAIFGNGNL